MAQLATVRHETVLDERRLGNFFDSLIPVSRVKW